MTVIRTGMTYVGWAIAAIALAACGGGDTSPTPAPTPTVVASPTVTPTAPPVTATPSPEELEAEVSAAYLAYWDAYAEAVLNLDITPLEGLVSPGHRALLSDEVDTLRTDGFAMRVSVEHDFVVLVTCETEAGVIDRLVNNSFYVDPSTKEPSEGQGSGEELQYTFLMERIDGRWVVLSGFQEAPD